LYDTTGILLLNEKEVYPDPLGRHHPNESEHRVVPECSSLVSPFIKR
jgi:hypothetical protein